MKSSFFRQFSFTHFYRLLAKMRFYAFLWYQSYNKSYNPDLDAKPGTDETKTPGRSSSPPGVSDVFLKLC